MPETPHKDLVFLGQGGVFGQGTGELRAGAALVIVVEEEIVEDGELVVRGAFAFAYLVVQGAEGGVVLWGVSFG